MHKLENIQNKLLISILHYIFYSLIPNPRKLEIMSRREIINESMQNSFKLIIKYTKFY